MKKILFILTIFFSLIFAGVLYGTHYHEDTEEPLSPEEVYAAHVPDPMPEVVISPMPGFTNF